MTEKLKQKMNGEIVKLSKVKQEAINSLDWGGITEETGKKYSLSEKELNDLQVETGLILVGLVNLNMYEENIEKNVGVTKNDAEKIAQEVFEKIFSPFSQKIISLTKSGVELNNVGWDKTVSFIISGGDYSYFVER
jgi:hypothetical protein